MLVSQIWFSIKHLKLLLQRFFIFFTGAYILNIIVFYHLQLEGKAQEITILKHHIRILEQENLNKISHIAELETQLHAMKVRA